MPIKNLLKFPFFKSSQASDGRSGGAGSGAVMPGESVELIRKRARHRLIGAAVLVLAGVIGFPLVFDTQPRPVSVDIPISIPDKSSVKPLVIPAAPIPAPASAASSAAGVVPAAGSMSPKEEVVAAKPEEKAPAAPAKPPTAAIKSEAKAPPLIAAPAPAAAKPAPDKPAGAVDDGRKAQALLEGKDSAQSTASAPSAAAAAGRFVVQVGAFADAGKAREVRLRVEKAGLKTYTQVAETQEGKRIRVRVGPFGSKAEADKAAARIKGLDLPAAILSL